MPHVQTADLSYSLCDYAFSCEANASPGLQALVGLVGPFELDGEATERAGLPGGNVADFAVVVVVPALARDRIGDRFAKFVRCGGSERVERRGAAEAAGTAGVRHHGVENIVIDRVVVAAENLAGSAAPLSDGDSGRKENKIKCIGRCGRECARRNLLLQELLDGGIVNRFPRRGSSE